MSNELQVSEIDWSEGQAAVRDIREQVFVLEQGVPPEIEIDGNDEEAHHFVGFLDGVPVACGRLQDNGKISRMAVLPVHRGRNFGRQVLEAIIARARELNLQRLYLHAQAHAGGFYRKAGFVASGDIFDEADIPHVAMMMDLSEGIADADPSSGIRNRVNYPQPFDSLAVALCTDARRELRIQSPQLDHRVFDQPELIAAVSALVRSSSQSLVRILIADSRPLIDRGHRLLELARRMPSKVHIRQLSEHPQWNQETVVIRDRDGLLFKPGGSDHDAFFEPHSRASAQRHLELFDELWRQGSADPNLRSLAL
jgi:predicted GNAT family N-acyltransferase